MKEIGGCIHHTDMFLWHNIPLMVNPTALSPAAGGLPRSVRGTIGNLPTLKSLSKAPRVIVAALDAICEGSDSQKSEDQVLTHPPEPIAETLT